ncbi:MAG: hypothetical protein QXT91_00575 [Candidatus Caldarchaeum sp.]
MEEKQECSRQESAEGDQSTGCLGPGSGPEQEEEEVVAPDTDETDPAHEGTEGSSEAPLAPLEREVEGVEE